MRSIILMIALVALVVSAETALGQACCVNGACRDDIITPGQCTAAGGSWMPNGQCNTSPNGHLNECAPCAGESRANKHQYLSSHNAYQDTLSLAEQLDHWNAWDIELDVRWRDDPDLPCFGDVGFYVQHNCFDKSGSGWLDEYLDDIAGTTRIQNGFFILNLELGDGYFCLGCLDAPTFPPGAADELRSLVATKFGINAIYTNSEFQIDGFRWPSPQELIRRGKHVAIHVNDYPPFTSNDELFFDRSDYTPGGGQTSGTFWNVDTPHHGSAFASLGDRRMIRRWPEASCLGESDADWAAALNNGFTLPSTNCLEDRTESHGAFLHPPFPMFVRLTSFPFIELGTSGLPYQQGSGLLAAPFRARFYNDWIMTVNQIGGPVQQSHPSRIDIHVTTGTYNVLGSSGVFNGPVRLIASGGPVTIIKSASVAAGGGIATCAGDLDGDGSIGATDLQLFLGTWGSGSGAADLNDDGQVGSLDLAVLMQSWGPCSAS